MDLRVFDPQTASEPEMRAAYDLSRTLQLEQHPDERPTSYEQFVRNRRSTNPVADTYHWLAWEGEHAIGNALISVSRLENNRHLAWYSLNVRPENRRQGVARQLLRAAAGKARQEGRTTLTTWTTSLVPSGSEALAHVRGKAVLEGKVSELPLATLDRAMLRQWIEQAPRRAPNYEIGLWEGRYPEEELEGVAALWELGNQIPRGEMNLEDEHVTPEQIRELDQQRLARGIERWSYYVRRRGGGPYMGFSEVFFEPDRPEVIEQGLTAVAPEARGQGLGRWLKAAMLEKILQDRPEATKVRTDNANVNAPMLAINHDLGFRQVASETSWELTLDVVDRYLG